MAKGPDGLIKKWRNLAIVDILYKKIMCGYLNVFMKLLFFTLKGSDVSDFLCRLATCIHTFSVFDFPVQNLRLAL